MIISANLLMPKLSGEVNYSSLDCLPEMGWIFSLCVYDGRVCKVHSCHGIHVRSETNLACQSTMSASFQPRCLAVQHCV